MAKLDPYKKAKILQLRGLGFDFNEIGKKLDLSYGRVAYWARKIEKQARAEGEDGVFIRVMVDGVTPEVLRFMEMTSGLKGL